MGWSRRGLGVLAGVLALAAPISHAQGGDRAQVMNRIVDGINSPDPVTRLITLEQAMATKDKNLHRIALTAAFSSSDVALRTAAIEAVFASKATFSVELTGMAAGTKDPAFIEKSGGRMDVWVRGFDPATGNFEARSNFSFWNNVTKDYAVLPGNLSGDRLSFSVNTNELGGGGSTCTGSAIAAGASALMNGSITCIYGQMRLTYTIKVDLLR